MTPEKFFAHRAALQLFSKQYKLCPSTLDCQRGQETVLKF